MEGRRYDLKIFIWRFVFEKGDMRLGAPEDLNPFVGIEFNFFFALNSGFVESKIESPPPPTHIFPK